MKYFKTNEFKLFLLQYKLRQVRYYCSCRWGKTMSLNCSYKLAYYSSPRSYMSVESHSGIILTGETE
jgi:hypothetical protein